MSQSEERIFYLLKAFTSKTATVTEENELMEWMQNAQEDSELKLYMQGLWSHYDNKTKFDNVNWNNIFEDIMNKEKVHSIVTPSKRIPWTRIAAAVFIFSFLSAWAYFYLSNDPQKQIAKTDTSEAQLINDVVPGGNKAVLTLADGSQIVLDSAKNGSLTQQGNTKIIKLNNGELSYSPSGGGGEILYNTISTPRGGEYQIILSDGSKVWLNAASSLKFPTSFAGKERNVELSGEGYFEIVKNAAMPFRVMVNNSYIEVLGTNFNINSYKDELAVETTLLEGAVKVTNGTASLMLKPRQQAQIINSGNILLNKHVDINATMAWKDGFFEFDNTELQRVMRQISRWYDVNVVFDKNQSGETFGGRISKNLNLSSIMSMLETNGVKCRLEGKNLIVQQ